MVNEHAPMHAVLRSPTPHRLRQVASADIVIGFTTHSIPPARAAQLARQAVIGAEKYFPGLKTVIINTDTGLSSRTRDAIQAVGSARTPVIASRYTGVLGRGGGISAILHGALHLKPKVMVILDSHTTGISPRWIPALATLVLNGRAHIVKARYGWQLPDSALNDLLVYPFTRAIWKLNLQHPAGGDFALSPQCAAEILAQDVWGTEVNADGFDVWLNTFAITQGWRIAQAAVGEKPPQPALSFTRTLTRFKNVVGTMFRQLHLRQRQWQTHRKRIKVSTFTEFSNRAKTAPPDFDLEGHIEALALGWMAHRGLWQRIMFAENLAAVEYLASQPVQNFHFPSDLWAKIAYDFAVVYNKGERDPEAVTAALYPLFQGRLASFWGEVAGLTAVGQAGTVAAQAAEFEDMLSYLNYRWEKYLPWVDSGEKR